MNSSRSSAAPIRTEGLFGWVWDWQGGDPSAGNVG